MGCAPAVTTNSGPSVPAPGTLDASFGSGGIVITDYVYESSSDPGNFYSAYNEINAIALQSDGKIVVAGYADISGDRGEDFAIARYNPNGTLDTTFGTGGFVLTDFGDTNDQATAIAIQADGKIVVAGIADRTGNKKFALARYNNTGTPDTSFGTNGKVTTDVSSENNSGYATAMVIQSDGKILVAGYADIGGKSQFVVVRYTSNGTLDDTFDGDTGTGNGIVTTAFTDNAYANALALDSSGKILVAGYTDTKFALARYQADGNLDTSFDTDGKVETVFGGNAASAYAIAVQNDGKIMLGGSSNNSSSPGASYFALARYNSNGALDTSFGNAGQVETYMGLVGTANLCAMKIQNDGKIVTAGSCQKDSKENFAFVRYTLSGILDTSFGTDGKVLTSSGSKSWLNSLLIQSDGKIVGGGLNEETETGTTNFALLRLWP